MNYLAQIEVIDEALTALRPHSRQRRPLLERRARTLWHLERFGGFRDDKDSLLA